MKYIIIGVVILAGIVYFNLPTDKEVIDIIEPKTKTGIGTPIGNQIPLIPIPVNIQFATTTDEFENVIKTGLKIPVGTTTFDMNLDGYDSCRQKKTKATCLEELRDDIRQNIKTYQINKARERAELNRKKYQDEIDLGNL